MDWLGIGRWMKALHLLLIHRVMEIVERGLALTAATSGKYGNGGSFNGTSDYIEMADTPSLSPGGAFTFSTWIYQTAACTSDCIIFNKESEYEWRILNGSVDYAIANTSPGWNWISTGITISQNTWTHLILTYDSNTQEIKAYKNGDLVYTRTSSTGTIGDVGQTLRLAARKRPGSFFGGKLDETRIYNRALSLKKSAICIIRHQDRKHIIVLMKALELYSVIFRVMVMIQLALPAHLLGLLVNLVKLFISMEQATPYLYRSVFLQINQNK